MKRLLSSLGLAAALLPAHIPTPAQAGDECWAAVGGFLGGVIFSSAVRTSYCPPQPVYYCPPPVVTHRVVIEEPVEVGYYEYRDRQVWVPGCWVYERDRCGRRVRAWREGYYKCVQVKVWVPGSRPRHYARYRGHEW